MAAGPLAAFVCPARLVRSTAAVLAVTAGLLAGAGEARAQSETEHWSATLTRGDAVDNISGNHGYVRPDIDPAQDEGTLVPS